MTHRWTKPWFLARALVVVCVFVHSASPRAELSSPAQENAEESEILYADARIAANGGDFAKALPIAIEAMNRDPDNLRAAELVLACSQQLKRPDLAAAASKAIEKGKRRERLLKQAADQLRSAAADMESDRWKVAGQRLEYVTRLRDLRSGDGADVVGEARFRLGLTYLARSDVSNAIKAMSASDPKYRQQSAVALGNYFLQRGYLSDALARFQFAAFPGGEGRDPTLADASAHLARNLNSSTFGLVGSVSYLMDSNPFGFPDGSVLSDGSSNSDRSLSLFLNTIVRGPASASNPFVYSFTLGGSQAYSVEQGLFRQLDSRMVILGFNLSAARYDVGRSGIRASYQYLASPLQTADDPEYHTASRTATIAFDLSKELSPGVDLSLSYRYSSAQFVTASDTGSSDRSGGTQGAYSYLSLRTLSRWWNPGLRIGYDSANLVGDSVAYQILYGALVDSIQLGKGGAGTDVSIGYESQPFLRYSGGRTDRTLRLGVALGYPMTARMSAFLQAFYASTASTVDYYKQTRLTSSVGTAFSL